MTINEYSIIVSGEGPCHMLRQCLKNHTSEGDEDYKLIQCDKFGLFKALQRQQNGNIICAWPDGEFPEPYGVTPGKRECLGKPCIYHVLVMRLPFIQRVCHVQDSV